MDITTTTEPKSDQQNFDDYVAGPKTVTISEVRLLESDQQPMHLHLVEFPGRPYKPNLSMRRVLLGVWGKSGLAGWAGRQLTLYGDPHVRFGKHEVGGIKISHLSHIDEPATVNLTVTRGKKEPFTVQPLALAVTVEEAGGWLLEAETLPDLQAVWGRVQQAGLAGDQELVELKNERKAELSVPDS